MSLVLLVAATAARIAEVLETAPGWCRVGLTAPTASIREQATQELAVHIAAGLDGPAQPAVDRRQLALPLAGRQ